METIYFYFLSLYIWRRGPARMWTLVDADRPLDVLSEVDMDNVQFFLPTRAPTRRLLAAPLLIRMERKP